MSRMWQKAGVFDADSQHSIYVVFLYFLYLCSHLFTDVGRSVETVSVVGQIYESLCQGTRY